MGQDSPWNMLLPAGTGSMLFCELCATQMELIGGVRCASKEEEEDEEDIKAAEDAEADTYYDPNLY